MQKHNDNKKINKKEYIPQNNCIYIKPINKYYYYYESLAQYSTESYQAVEQKKVNFFVDTNQCLEDDAH